MNLILQGPSLTESLAKELGAVERINDRAFRLRNVTVRESVAAWCEQHRVDYAWMPYGTLGDTHRFTLSYRF